MHSFSVPSFLATAIMLLAYVRVGITFGLGQVWHTCPYDVWCSGVQGCPASTPPGECPGAEFVKVPPMDKAMQSFANVGPGTGFTIMCTRDPTASPILVTQLEWTWEPEQGLTYLDVSNVAGHPFVDNGFAMHAMDPQDPNRKQNRCYDAYCAPGDVTCNQAYEVWNDDLQAMRSCFDNVVLDLQLCTNA